MLLTDLLALVFLIATAERIYRRDTGTALLMFITAVCLIMIGAL